MRQHVHENQEGPGSLDLMDESTKIAGCPLPPSFGKTFQVALLEPYQLVCMDGLCFT